MQIMTYYRRHVFVCENRRANGECCANRPAADSAVKLLREILKSHNLLGGGKMRINRAGCFNRCARGPILVIYPDAVWYRYDNEDDLREIAHAHLIGEQPVRRLQLSDLD